MLRSMLQTYVKDSVSAVAFYQRAFDAKLLCAFPHEDGTYLHCELDVWGQVLAVSELQGDANPGNTMQFCLHLGEGHEETVKAAYAVLREGAAVDFEIGPCDFSPCMFSLVDRYQVRWCVFV